MSTRRASAVARRRTKSIEAMKSARDTIGPIEREMGLFAITRGQFSMIDVINDLIDKAGPSHLSVWTWAIAAYEVDVIMGLMERKDVLSATLVVDYSAEQRTGSIIDQWRGRFGHDSVKDCRNHAKIARVWNDQWRFLARGSMNLNFNPRFEQFDLTEGGADFDLVTDIENELPVLGGKCTRAQADMATGVGGAFEQSTLELFGKVSTWAK
jgi:hypothetical protein